MSAKIAKKCRALAYAEAKRQGLWKRGEGSVWAKWWRRLFARISKKYKARWLDRVGSWYRRILKSWAKEEYANLHDREYQELMRVREKINRQFARRYHAQK